MGIGQWVEGDTLWCITLSFLSFIIPLLFFHHLPFNNTNYYYFVSIIKLFLSQLVWFTFYHFSSSSPYYTEEGG